MGKLLLYSIHPLTTHPPLLHRWSLHSVTEPPILLSCWPKEILVHKTQFFFSSGHPASSEHFLAECSSYRLQLSPSTMPQCCGVFPTSSSSEIFQAQHSLGLASFEGNSFTDWWHFLQIVLTNIQVKQGGSKQCANLQSSSSAGPPQIPKENPCTPQLQCFFFHIAPPYIRHSISLRGCPKLCDWELYSEESLGGVRGAGCTRWHTPKGATLLLTKNFIILVFSNNSVMLHISQCIISCRM